jgi:3-oxoacyl-[acyl-carrier-protein] synthase-3
MKSIITGTGSVLPSLVVPNSHFEQSEFYDKSGHRAEKSSAEIVAKLEAITGIRERRYVPFDEDSIPLMTRAAQNALNDAQIDANRLSGIIVAHNAGNMLVGEKDFHPVPNLAACLKHELHCTNHECFAYDILFGCPGWLQAVIQAHQAILCGDAESVLVVGLEVASRLLDPHDVDSMILADGCGACVVTRSETEDGILAYATFSHAEEDLGSIYLGKSNNPCLEGSCFFHMNGREVYKYATHWVPKIIQKALNKANLDLREVDLFLFHQANAKMLEAIARNLGELYQVPADFFDGKIPSTIEFLGNTSVATIPTMLDLVLKGQMEGFEIKKGQIAVMASVGAGMHCNSLVYRF